QAAAAQGQRAGLVEHNRPNLFRTSVANVGPGETVSVRIAYWQAVAYRDGDFSIALPLALTRRYTPLAGPVPGNTSSAEKAIATAHDTAPEALPAVLAADQTDHAPMPVVSLRVDLTPGIALDNIRSPTHGIKSSRNGDRYVIR